MKIFRYLSIAFAVLTAVSCSFLHDDEPVAKVGKEVLYLRQLRSHIPGGLSPQDSAAMAENYINAWASGLIINKMAEVQLSDEEKDVTKELEEYRSSLLKYRYEQHYISERLDTLVTEEQINAVYEATPQDYKLSFPILKARYISFHDNPKLHDSLLKLLSSDSEGDLQLLDSLSNTIIDKFTVFGGEWIDIVTLARFYGMDYGTLLSAMESKIIDIVDEQGENHLSYIIDYLPAGVIPPLEYCRDLIREVIMSQRKNALMMTLERDLLERAKSSGDLVIYEKNDK